MSAFKEAIERLNINQKKAVETTEGPVMVIAGPGTGKTQVLALRIAYILDTGRASSDEVLCLTFTRSGALAMRKRLESYIGDESRRVSINTFHGFALEYIEKYYQLLGFHHPPKLLDDTDAITLVDTLLQENDWEYIRPRTNPAMYFGDLKQLISILKRERVTPEEFLSYIEEEIEFLSHDPNSMSSRGETKGQIKKEVQKKIESLSRTREVVLFYTQYEKEKKDAGLMDYDDVLEYIVALAEDFEDVRGDIKERYLYVLVDEHQDSSGVQNNFLKAVWGDVESPNIFVVGDDRQLIYGFSGASLSYFEEFSTFFGKATCITLTDNYRSTSPILTLADTLLKSTLTDQVLVSTKQGDTLSVLAEYQYPRDEIIAAGLLFKQKIAEGVPPEECALLVPKNRHVRSAIILLQSMGLPVSSSQGSSLFMLREVDEFCRVLGIVADSSNNVLLTKSILDKVSNIPAREAHAFLYAHRYETVTIDHMLHYNQKNSLFDGEQAVYRWGKTLDHFVNSFAHSRVSQSVSAIGNDLFVKNVESHEALLRSIEIVRSMMHLALVWEEKNPNGSLREFLLYIERLRAYGSHIEIAGFEGTYGIQVMTLHKSKGLEYECVWIAHTNEEVLMSEKRSAFTLPEKVQEKIVARDEETARRELYVAITRAKEFCTISYAEKGYSGVPMELAHIVALLPHTHFVKKSSEETQKELLTYDPHMYVASEEGKSNDMEKELLDFVTKTYPQTKVSVTLLNNFFECPWKWYFRNFLRLPEVKSASLALGSAVHAVIEFILKQDSLPNVHERKEKIARALFTEGVIDKKELSRLSRDAEKAVTRWVHTYFDDLSKERMSERSLSFSPHVLPHLQLYGKIDLVERFSDGSVIVTDFKTGASKTASAIEKINEEGRLSSLMRQLAMYSYLIRGVEKDTEVALSRLLFIEEEGKNALYQIHIDENHLDLLVRDIQEYDRLLQTREWIYRPCMYKGYGDNAECPHCALARSIFKEIS